MGKRKTIKQIIMERDNMSEYEADDLINLAKEEFEYYLDIGDMDGAEGIASEFFGLEPDYLDEFM